MINCYSPQRRKTIPVKIGNITIGSGYPVAVQSMCNTKTSDVESSCAQIEALHNAGADIVRLTTPTLSDVDYLNLIHERTKHLGMPLCADVHFNSAIALKAAGIVEKVRVNPGNYAKQEDVDRKFTELLHLASAGHVAIRIGVNHGSLSAYMMAKWGDTPRGMAESAMEFLRIAKREGFNDVVVSLKSSNPRVMVESYRLCAALMADEDMYYPMHLGVTEAGEGNEGRIRSAVGIGALMADGIGDTIRVSLTEDPVEEIPVGRIIARHFQKLWQSSNSILEEIPPAYDPLLFRRRTAFLPIVVGKGGDFETLQDNWIDIASIGDGLPENSDVPIVVSSDSACWVGHVRYLISRLAAKGITNPVILRKNYPDIPESNIIAAAEMGAVLIDGIADGVCIEKGGAPTESSLGYSILQAARLRTTCAEIISCPGCGRTQYDIQSAVKAVKERFGGYANLKIAVMGCIVNGPGEMADADWGYVGAGGGKVSIYKGHDVVVGKVDQAEALDILENLIKQTSGYSH